MNIYAILTVKNIDKTKSRNRNGQAACGLPDGVFSLFPPPRGTSYDGTERVFRCGRAFSVPPESPYGITGKPV